MIKDNLGGGGGGGGGLGKGGLFYAWLFGYVHVPARCFSHLFNHLFFPPAVQVPTDFASSWIKFSHASAVIYPEKYISYQLKMDLNIQNNYIFES